MAYFGGIYGGWGWSELFSSFSLYFQDFHSCYRTPGPQKGFRRVSEGLLKGSLKESLDGFLKGF